MRQQEEEQDDKTPEKRYIKALEERLISINDYKDKIKHKTWIIKNRKYFGVK